VTTFLLIRHGAHDLPGNALAGRTRDISLNARGREQAEALIERIAGYRIDHVYVSPRRRALETIAPFIADSHVPQDVELGFDEIDFGTWSGRAFA